MKINIFRNILLFSLFFGFLTLLGMQLLDRSQQKSAPNIVWEEIDNGNKEFINNAKYAQERNLLKDQVATCVVLGCSDSRVPPELVFNQGLGKLFVARVAGEVVDATVIDSIEFFVTHYDTHLIIVLGHTKCGAVQGAINRLIHNKSKKDEVKNHLNAILAPIETAILQSEINIYAPDALEKATRANVRYQAEQLISESKPIAKEIEEGTLTIIGAEYDLDTGKVEQLFTIGQF